MHDRLIAYPGDRPPMVVPAPCDMRGLMWTYFPLTPEHAQGALRYHARRWADWSPDPELVTVAEPTT